MPQLKDVIAKKVLPAMKNITPRMVVTGEPDHPRRLRSMVTIPDYVGGFATSHEDAQLCLCLSGTCVLKIGIYAYRLRPYDLCIIAPNTHHFESYLGPAVPYELAWINLKKTSPDLTLVRCRYIRKKFGIVDSLHFPVLAEQRGIIESLTEKNPALGRPEKKSPESF